ncbi:Subtilisin-like protease SBT3.3 [Euphorbia peplus]|nr:Subtilisin-like protease SBT3.3 [Euphorbia peplus]
MIKATPVHAWLVNLILLFFCAQTQLEAASNVHIVYLGEKQHHDPKLITDSHHDILANIVGSKQLASELMVYSYRHGFSGFAAKLTEFQAKHLAELPGVVKVIPNTLHKLQTTRSWDFLGLPASSHANPLPKSSMGDGVIVGVLDTGIWPESKSFGDEGLGPIPSRWKGACKSGGRFNAEVNCNKKVIGAYWYVDGFEAEYGEKLNTSGGAEFLSPRDANGHGTHTASTAAGAVVGNVSYKGLGHGTIRGGAPLARLAIYKVCWNVLGGQCSSADILKAFDQAIHDGVDVLSISIGASIPLFSDIDERDGIATGSFHAVAKGITVVCGASNGGPSAQTVQNTAPWILTVAASTMDRAFPTPITLGNNNTFLGQATFAGLEAGFQGLVYPPAPGLDPNAAGVCESLSLNDTLVNGKVVLCFTSTARRGAVTTAAQAVKAAGGVGLIVAKNPNDALYPCSGDFPCIEVDYEIGTRIVFYIRSTTSPVVKLSRSKTIVGKPVLPKVAYFSSRGPNSLAPAILKPDIAAPGVNILAATSPLGSFNDGGYVMHSGTSMSTPHVAGIVSLVKASHPAWSPAAIKSALVTTAWQNYPTRRSHPIFAEGSPAKLADPFDYGGGIVNPNGAIDPGLIYDMGTADYVQYLCAMGYNANGISTLAGNNTVCPSKPASILDLNLPSITIPHLRKAVIVTRRVTNVGNSSSIYQATIVAPFGISVSVNPNVLAFNGQTKEIEFSVRITANDEVNAGFYFGSLSWSDGFHIVKIPLSVRTELLQLFINQS